VALTRTTLSALSHELLYVQAEKIIQLASLLETASSSTGLKEDDTAQGGFSSQIGRLGIVLEKLAYVAKSGADVARAEVIFIGESKPGIH